MSYDKQKHVEEVIKKIESIIGYVETKKDLEEKIKQTKEYKLKPYYIDCTYILTKEAMEERKKEKYMTPDERADALIKHLEEQIENYDDNILKSEPFIDEEIRKREIGNIVKSLGK